MALGGHRFINICNNQMKVGFQGSRYIGEDARPGRNIWGGIVFLFGALKKVTKNKKMHCGLRRLPGNILDATTNQKHAITIEGGQERKFER